MTQIHDVLLFHGWLFGMQQNPGWQSTIGRDKDLFQLRLSCEEGVCLIFMIEKHILIFRTLQSNPGVAATPPPIQVEIDKS